ncbi:mannose/fructose/sorbose PTS transporter subunit IIB [Clostridium sp. KNHs214]|uniref:mannose/fructose/sorbose PTS transporter subunit IIB n=1 Tax=Clostridium sp. KNHs214 TaxID=1540257 RepID=UPI000553ECE0|nr:mannose/fructose/sorbose PTS transporter subunit IIB [Clostridium sp. KNHs214]
MNIVLARIDDRLIHGQVATIWTKETKCTRIIVCNDDVANDDIRKTLLTQVAPPGIKAHVVDLAKAVRVYNNPKYENDKVMFLFTNPSDVLTLVENGVDIKSVNIGGMSFKEGKKKITGAVSVDDKDIEAFKKLSEKGIELEIRKVAADSKADIMPLIQNLIQK